MKFEKYDEAKVMLSEQLELKRKYYGPKNQKIAHKLLDLAVCLGRVGEIQKKYDYLVEAHQIYKKTLPEDHSMWATLFNFLASANIDKGELETAKQYLTQALTISENAWGSKHHKCVSILRQFGDIYDKLGEYNEAKAYYQRALRIKQRCNLSDNECCYLWERLADGEFRLGNFEASRQYYSEALKVFKKVFGENHINIGLTSINLANIYSHLNDQSHQLEMITQTLKISKLQSTITEKNFRTLAAGIWFLPNSEAKLNLLQEALILSTGILGEYHQANFQFYRIMADVLGQFKNTEDLIPTLEKCLKIQKMGNENSSLERAKVEFLLSRAYVERKDFKKAQDHFNTASTLFDNILGPNNLFSAMCDRLKRRIIQ